MPSPVPTNQIIAGQYEVLNSLISRGDRVGFYAKLYDFTGSKAALAMGQIASSSGLIGGIAWAVNSAYDVALPGYPEKGVESFSIDVATADWRSIRPDPSRPGAYLVPRTLNVERFHPRASSPVLAVPPAVDHSATSRIKCWRLSELRA